ncbi:hypothetical protein ACIQLK_13620 [Microbacterium sp. NPDC091382]|uniref:hypothetical protein n=1 Tax=Microbacterium sp. NPDC091382 TaxID=3364210 RepID=UPI0038190CF5
MIVVSVLAGLVLLGGLFLDNRESAEGRCWKDDHPVGVAVSETALLSAEATVWPAGRQCTWAAASGDGAVVTQTGWSRTVAFVSVTAVSAALAVVGLIRRRAGAVIPLVVCTVAFGLAVWTS